MSNPINLNNSSPIAFRQPTQPVINTPPPAQSNPTQAATNQQIETAPQAVAAPAQSPANGTATPPGQMGKGSSDCCGGNTTIIQGGGGGGGGFTTVTDVKTADYTAAIGELVRVDTTGGGFAVTLPASSPANAGKQIGIALQNDVGGFVTINTTGGDTVNGQPSGTFQYAPPPQTMITLVDLGTGNWQIQG